MAMRSFRRLIDAIVDIIYPPKCVGCGSVNPIRSTDCFCPECRKKWEEHKKEPCRRCGQPISECWCGVTGDDKGYVDAEMHLVQYDKSNSVIKRLLYFIKRYYSKRAFSMLADEMYNELYFRLDYNDLVVASVPRAPREKHKFGQDQSEILAREFCAIADLNYLDILINIGRRKQKELGYDQRMENARRSYIIKKGVTHLLKDKNVILIDDVVTTGATVSRCAHLLKWKGAKRVIVFSIAKTV